MSRKPKFKPEITRVKLNPEQAVLTCECFDTVFKGGEPDEIEQGLVCSGRRVVPGWICVSGSVSS